jgi:hypothetical protein
MGGGGKGGGGGSSTTEVKIPDWLRDPAIRNLERAETAQRLEYQPWMGLDVAGYTPDQLMAQQSVRRGAAAFGMVPQGYGAGQPESYMPAMVSMGGMSGYSAFPMYEQALREAQAADPRSARIREQLYTSPSSRRRYGTVNPRSIGGIDYTSIR